MDLRKFLTLTAAMAALTACSHLSPEAKKMVGDYYIPEVSEDEPLMELNKNGRCTIRKIVPGVITFSVEGKWNVKQDSLVGTLNPASLKVAQGSDSTLVGNLPERMAFAIKEFNDLSLTIERDGAIYTYYRRVK